LGNSDKAEQKELKLPHTLFEIEEMCRLSGIKRLGVSIADLNKVQNLPFQTEVKHNDPFDRILISQAIENDMTLVTCDDKISLYDVKTVW
jgi:PIN domain nuclease of toxin-antitoxin system